MTPAQTPQYSYQDFECDIDDESVCEMGLALYNQPEDIMIAPSFSQDGNQVEVFKKPLPSLSFDN